MKKLLLSLALALAMCLGLAACGHSHVWQDATCTAPKTCTECGATEGETLEHTWMDATCAAPKTCSACGAAEGEALAHTPGEANYQSPAVCSVCGETVGGPLAAAFESGELDKSGFRQAELGVTYDYHILAYDDPTVEQTNHVTFEDCRVIPSDDTHAARDGYEWQIVRLHFLSDDASVRPLGWSAIITYHDYYSGIELPVGGESYTVNYNGTDCECQSIFTSTSEWNRDHTVNDCWAEFAAQVPVGYDGTIVTVVERFSGDTLDGEFPHITDLSGSSVYYIRLGA